jgi:dipeptidyl aminopeptidase/acylaminoacyl peptidase
MHLGIRVPSAVSWSPDGQWLAHQVTGATGSEIHFYDVEGNTDRIAAEDIAPFRLYKDLPDLRWQAEGPRLIFKAGLDYQIVSPAGEKPQVYFAASLLGDLSSLSPDLAWGNFIREGNIWVQHLESGRAYSITRHEGLLASSGDLFSRLQQHPQWSPDSRWIAYLRPMAQGYKAALVSVRTGEQLNIVPDEDIWPFTVITWAPDSRRVALSRLSTNFCRKALSIYSLETQEERLIWEDRDDKWVDHNIRPGFDVAWNDDSRRIAFLSNRTGWRHLYLADVERGEVRLLTSGDFDCFWCGWQPGRGQITFVSNEDHHQTRRMWIVSAEGGQRRAVTQERGLCTGGWFLRQAFFAWSPDGERVAHIFGEPGILPELRITALDGSSAERVYTSRPTGISDTAIAHAEAVSFTGADELEVPAVLITPPGLDRSRQHPALVFAYGGWDQEAQLGWEFAPKNIIFNYLAGQGFVCLLIDPRGSEGYGDAHSKAQFREGGRKQCDDVAAAADFLRGLGYIAPDGIGLFGYSYGGYLVLQTMIRVPEAFAAGVAMAAVSEWATYSGYSTFANIRFGLPDEEPNPLYERSPVYHVQQLKGALLVVHGKEDFNVPVASAEALVSALMRAGKTFEYMVYPGEGHVWTQPHTIRDFLMRIERFLNMHLRRQGG